MALYQTKGLLQNLSVLIRPEVDRFNPATGEFVKFVPGIKAEFKDSFLKTSDKEVIKYLDSHRGRWAKLDSVEDARKPEKQPDFMRVDKKEIKRQQRVYEDLQDAEVAEKEEKVKVEVGENDD